MEWCSSVRIVLILILLGASAECLTKREHRALGMFSHKSHAFIKKLVTHIIQETNEDFFITPLAIQEALMFISAGARGGTKVELDEILGTKDMISELRTVRWTINEAYFYLHQSMMSALHKDVHLFWALGLFVKPGIPLETTFKQTMSRFSHVHIANISSTPFNDINDWASSATKGALHEFLPPRAVTPEMEMALTSALYLNVSWGTGWEFHEGSTVLRPFHSLSGKTTNLWMLRHTRGYKSVNLDGHQITKLFLRSVDNDKKSLTMYLADFRHSSLEDGVRLISDPWAMEQYTRYNDHRYPPTMTTVYLPKFRIQNHLAGLKEELKGIGIKKAFSKEEANFQGISSSPGLHLEKMFQQSVLEVNEQGFTCNPTLETFNKLKTNWGDVGPRPQPGKMEGLVFDRPFFFSIWESSSNSLLFLGLFTGNEPDNYPGIKI